MRPLLFASSLLLVLGTAAADPDVAPETATPPTAAATPPAPSAAATPPASEAPKKAQSTSAETKPKADAKKSAAEMRKISDTFLQQCMQDWDAATHMTKKEWERTCRRVVQARAKFMLDQMDK